MTDQQAEELARKLEWVWGPMSPITTSIWTLTNEEFRFKCRVVDDMHVELVQQLQGGRKNARSSAAWGNQYDTDSKAYSYFYCVQDQERAASISDDIADVSPTLNAHYLPRFRRNCFLSGFNIEASAHEKMEWLQDFARVERESQVPDERSQWEARRIAAAFDMDEWQKGYSPFVFHGSQGQRKFSWVIHQQKLENLSMWVEGERTCIFNTGTEGWCSDGKHLDFLARGLFRLGFEEQPLISRLPSLTDHEQLEARRTMPREFWPKTWLDEEAQ